MNISNFGRRPYTLLGRLLARRMPEIARELIDAHKRESVEPSETDLSRLQVLLEQFCTYKCIHPDNLTGNLHKSARIEVRREYIGAMLHLYNPQVYLQPNTAITFRFGFIKGIANVLKIHENNMGRALKETIFQEKLYQDFGERVKAAVEYLKQREAGNGST